VESIKKKYTRLKAIVTSKYALNSEGANLSGLANEEDTPETTKMLINMIRDEADEKDSAKVLKDKNEKRQEAMLVHESKVIKTTSTTSSKFSPENASFLSPASDFVTPTPVLSFEQAWLENGKFAAIENTQKIMMNALLSIQQELKELKIFIFMFKILIEIIN
jgi:acetoin utilization deacetylase AcuC-like enzyme